MRFDAPVLLLGAGPVSANILALVQGKYRHVVAADGGLAAVERFGLKPEAVIGDMDSISPAHRAKYRAICHEIAEQDSTDFEKCLGWIDAPLILGIGFLGGRLDHELAALAALVKQPANIVLISEVDIVFRPPQALDLTLPVGARISFFPMGVVRDIRSEGLAWPLEGKVFSPDTAISISNKTVADRVTLADADQPLLCILPREHLAATLNRFKY